MSRQRRSAAASVASRPRRARHHPDHSKACRLTSRAVSRSGGLALPRHLPAAARVRGRGWRPGSSLSPLIAAQCRPGRAAGSTARTPCRRSSRVRPPPGPPRRRRSRTGAPPGPSSRHSSGPWRPSRSSGADALLAEQDRRPSRLMSSTTPPATRNSASFDKLQDGKRQVMVSRLRLGAGDLRDRGHVHALGRQQYHPRPPPGHHPPQSPGARSAPGAVPGHHRSHAPAGDPSPAQSRRSSTCRKAARPSLLSRANVTCYGSY